MRDGAEVQSSCLRLSIELLLPTGISSFPPHPYWPCVPRPAQPPKLGSSIADNGSGPGPGDPSSLVWWYHSHVNEPEETNLGLLGPIIITRRGMARPDGSPIDVDREFVAAFFIFNELGGREPGLMHGINGYIFGNLRGLVMNNGQRVRWYLLGMGNEVDLHTAHWHGKTVRVGQHRTDVIELLPGSMVTVDMLADNPGTWLFHCHVADLIDAGMLTTYTILP
jgi:manganese oxidase